jgi:polysaccharide deacetylase family protein (PEP-CTERM system associated)
LNILGIDFEEWYHLELVKPHIKNKKRSPSVINGIDKILDLLRKHETLATFFVVGELLEIQPEIFDKIIENNHEIGFHTMYHDRLDSPGFKEKFPDEIKKFEKLTNGKSQGFRAPTFSLNTKSSWAIDVLEKNNYVYDSSIVPAKTNLYGMPNANNKPYKISSKCLEENSEDGKIIEFPLLVTKFLGKKIPAGGGFYLRTLPLRVIENAIKSYEKQKIPGVFYIHSWELVPELMPKIQLPKKDHFITFHNINRAYSKMEKLLDKYDFTSFENFIQNMGEASH